MNDSTPAPLTESQERHLRKALDLAFVELRNDGIPNITRGAIAAKALEIAMATLRKLPDREARWLKGGGSWPDTTSDGAGMPVGAGLELQLIAILAEVKKTDTSPGNDDEALRPGPARMGDVDRMDVVFEAYRTSLTGRNRIRDWRVVCYSAMGMPSKRVGKIAKTSRDLVRQIKHLQAGAVGKALAEWMPEDFEVAKALDLPYNALERAA